MRPELKDLNERVAPSSSQGQEEEVGMVISAGRAIVRGSGIVVAVIASLVLVGCMASYQDAPQKSFMEEDKSEYLIGPGDSLQVFVWRNPDLTTSVPVRPDGRISVPLIENVIAAGKTPSQLGSEIEEILKEYIQEPQVTIIVTGFVGPFAEQIRIVGEATEPRAISYKRNMTVLDAMIQVGGLTEFAAGNRAVIVRKVDGQEQIYRVRLNDLLRGGDVGANVELVPGDVIIIPETRF